MPKGGNMLMLLENLLGSAVRKVDYGAPLGRFSTGIPVLGGDCLAYRWIFGSVVLLFSMVVAR